MARSAQKQAQRETFERELQEVRSAIRRLPEAAEGAQEHGLRFELERAQEKEIQLLDALAELDEAPD